MSQSNSSSSSTSTSGGTSNVCVWLKTGLYVFFTTFDLNESEPM